MTPSGGKHNKQSFDARYTKLGIRLQRRRRLLVFSIEGAGEGYAKWGRQSPDNFTVARRGEPSRRACLRRTRHLLEVVRNCYWGASKFGRAAGGLAPARRSSEAAPQSLSPESSPDVAPHVFLERAQPSTSQSMSRRAASNPEGQRNTSCAPRRSFAVARQLLLVMTKP